MRLISSGDEAGLAKILTKDQLDARLTTGDTPLIVACALGKLSIGRLLVEQGADVNATSSRGWTPLMAAAFFGGHDIANYLLESGANADYRSDDGTSARSIAEWRGDDELIARLPAPSAPARDTTQELVRAVSVQDHAAINRLLNSGVKPNASDQSGTPALLIAAASNDTLSLSELLKAGASPDLSGPNGVTSLMVATQQRRLEAIKLLLAAGADPLRRAGEKGPSALKIADVLGYDDISGLLRGAVTRPSDPEQGLSLFTAAVAADDKLQVDRLLRSGFKPTGGAIHGRRVVPVSIAAFRGYQDLLPSLLSAGADVNEPDDHGATPLMAAIAGGHSDVADALIRSGARPEASNRAGVSAVALARSLGWRRLGSQDLYTKIDFDSAIKTGDVATLRALLNAGNHNDWINARDERGWPSLTRAAEAGSLDTVLLLLSRGAEVEVADGTVPSALMVAAAMGKKDIAEALLKQGADSLREDGGHHTAADMAKQRNQQNIAALVQASARANARRINAGLAELGYLNSSSDAWTSKSRDALERFYNEFPSGHAYDAPLTYGASAAIEEVLQRTVRVCNSTPKKVWVAWVRHPQDYAETENVEGWAKIEPSGCTWIVSWNDSRSMRPIWITAESIGDIKWSGEERFCIPRTSLNGMSVSRAPGCSGGTHEAGFWHVVPNQSPNPVILRYRK